jgi:hypothetical protein
MTPTALGLVVACGMLIAGGLAAAAMALLPAPVRLADALGRLSGIASVDDPVVAGELGTDRLGAWAYRTLRLPLSAGQRRALHLRGMSISAFYAEKVVWFLIGLVTPGVVTTLLTVLVGLPWQVPLAVSLAGGTAGFFVPDLQIRSASTNARQDAGEALFTFLDLITLERLANQSATQSLHAAAAVSDATPFRQIREALERARLEQQPPYAELRALSDDLGLPELRDIADIMAMDEHGASLAATLRARVKELRDAHLTRQRISAQEVSERMTVFMVIPAMVFGLIFLIPPILRLVMSP